MKQVGALICAFALVGCQANAGDVCGTLTKRSGKVPQNFKEQYGDTLACVEQWSAKLARSKQDSVAEVAEAVMTVCRGSIEALEQASPPNAMSGEDHLDYDENMRDHAKFIVVQTRAGDCYKAG